MKATGFYSLKSICGNAADFHRKKEVFCSSGVYFWGFTLREDAGIPVKPDEFVIYYIGKSERNIVERIMQEVTHLFGGFGTIIDHNWLISNPFRARIFNKQESDNNETKPLDPEVLYKSYGLHVLCDFFTNTKTQATINWMRERLIFTWIETDDIIAIPNLESELHHIVRTNCLGIGRIKTLLPKKDIAKSSHTPFFHSVDWSGNCILKDWLIEVNKRIS